MRVQITNEYVLPDLVGRVVKLEALQGRFPDVVVRESGEVEVWVPGERPRQPGRYAGVGFILREEAQPEPQEEPPVGFLDPETLEGFLREARAEGRDAYEVWREAQRGLMREVVPARLERTSDIYGMGAVVAIIEVDGHEVDRVALETEWETLEGVALLDARMRGPLAPVRAFPYGSEETARVMEILEQYFWMDYEDYRGHTLGRIIAVGWR